MRRLSLIWQEFIQWNTTSLMMAMKCLKFIILDITPQINSFSIDLRITSCYILYFMKYQVVMISLRKNHSAEKYKVVIDWNPLKNIILKKYLVNIVQFKKNCFWLFYVNLFNLILKISGHSIVLIMMDSASW